MVYLELSTVVLLILVNGLLAMSELALISSRKSRLEQLAKQGSRGAQAALHLVNEQGRFLSTIQIGITLIGIVAGAVSGVTLGRRIGVWLTRIPMISEYGETIGIGITVVGITYLSLILGELVPKRIALARPEWTATLVARPIRGLLKIAAPGVWLLHVSTEWVLRILRLTGKRESSVTEEEIKTLITEGTRSGVFLPQEKELIEGVLRLADRPVRIIMTPRAEIAWVDIGADWREIAEKIEKNRVSRLLVCEGSLDHPIGVIHSKELLPKSFYNGAISLREIIKPVLFVPETSPLLHMLGSFKREKIHFAVVVDEYGSTEGVATLSDLIEAIAGDLPEQGEEDNPKIVKREDGSWLADGTMPTDEVAAVTGIEMGEDVQMLAGFMLAHLGRMPTVGAVFFHGGARFEVVDMDGNRIDQVLIALTETDSDAPS